MHNNDDYKKQNGNGFATALGAAVIGAAVGAAAAYLSDPQHRKKVADKAHEAKDSASKMVSDVADKTGSALEDAGKKVKSNKNKVSDAVDDVTSPNDTFGAF